MHARSLVRRARRNYGTVLIISSMVITSCSGGGGSGLLHDNEQSQSEQSQSSSQILSEFTGIRDSSTSYLLTDRFYHTTNKDKQECSGAECVLTRTDQTLNISEIDFSYIEYESAMTRNGVKMARGDGGKSLPGQGFNDDLSKADASVETSKYAGWIMAFSG